MKKLILLFIIAVGAHGFAGDLVWKTGSGLEKWHALFRVKCIADAEGLKLTDIGYDHAIGIENLDIDPTKYNTLEITYRARIGRSKTVGQFYFANTNSRFSDARCWRLPTMKNDGKWHTLKATLNDLPDKSSWLDGGIINKLRLDLLDPAGGEIDIAQIKLSYDPAVSSASPVDGIIWESGSGLEKWHALFRVKCTADAEGLKLTDIGYDHAIGIDGLALNPQDFNTLEITYRARIGRTKTVGQFYFANANSRFSDARCWRLPTMKNDGKWHTLKATLNDLPDQKSWLDGGIINKLRLDLLDPAGGEIDISRIRLYKDPGFKKKISLIDALDAPRHPVVKTNFYPGYVPKKLEIPYYTGKMIFHRDDKGQNAVWYLRKSFDLEDVPVRALAQYLADDSGKLFINGKLVSTTDTWEQTTAVEVGKYLKKGANVVAIEYLNIRSAGGVLFDLQVQMPDGTMKKVVSDETFAGMSKPFANWTTVPEIPDGVTAFPVKTALPPPASPWTKEMKYQDISRSYKIIAVKTAKNSYNAGETVALEVSLQGKLPDFPTSLELHCFLPSGLPLPPRAVRLNEKNVKIISRNGQWSFTCSYPLPKTLHSMRMTLQLKSSWEMDKVPEVSFDYIGKNISADKRIPLTSEVRQTPVGPRLFINGEMTTFAASTVSRFSKPDKMDLSFRLLFPYTPDHGTSKKQWWAGIDKYDFTVFDLAAEEAIREYPNAKFFVQISCYPPEEWIKKYPGELAVTEAGKPSAMHLKINETPISFSSEIALRDIKNAVTACIEYLEKSPYADRIAGYRIIGGHTAEWIGWGHAEKLIFDYSEPARKAFVKYAAKHAPDAGITAIPSEKERLSRASDNGNLLNDKENLATILYNRFYSDSIVDMVIELCRTAKAACGGRKVVGTYYGYSIHTPAGMYFQGTGHFNLVRLLESKAVDFVMSPPSYTVRAIGGTMADMKPFKTIADHGVLSMIEDDTRTHAIPPLKRTNYDQTLNPEQSVAVMRRNLGMALCRQQPLLLYPFYGIYHSEFSFPEMIQLMNDLQAVDAFCQNRNVARKADVALVFSEQSLNMYAYEKRYVRTGGAFQDYNWTGASGLFPQGALKLTGSLILGQTDTLARSGAVCDYILSEDLANHTGDYKLYIFAGVLNYDEKFLQAVKKLRQKNVTLLWLHAPGFSKDFTADLSYMKELTGFDLAYLPSAPAEIRLNNGTLTGIAEDTLTPAFFIRNESNAKVLGKYRDTDYTGMAEIREGNSRSIFCGSYRFSTAFMRELANSSGAHIYTASGDPIEANENLFMLHARFPGKKLVKLKKNTVVLDIFERKIISRGKNFFTLEMPLHTTKLFYCGDDADELLDTLNAKEQK